MRTLEITDATAPLAEYAKSLRKGPVIVTKKGKPFAALMALAGVDAETIALSTNPRFIEILEESRARLKTEGGISIAKARSLLGLPAKPPRRRSRVTSGGS